MKEADLKHINQVSNNLYGLRETIAAITQEQEVYVRAPDSHHAVIVTTCEDTTLGPTIADAQKWCAKAILSELRALEVITDAYFESL